MEYWQRPGHDRRKVARKTTTQPVRPEPITTPQKPRITTVGLRNDTHQRLLDYCVSDSDIFMTDAASEAVDEWLDRKGVK